MVVARCDVGRQRPQRVERRLVALLQLQVHVFLDQVHRHVAGTFDHHLHVMLPRDLGQLAQGFQFTQLRLVVGVVDRAWPQAVTERERHVVGLHDGADVFEMLIQERFLVVRQTPFRHDRAAARDDAGHPFGRHRHVAQQHAGVDGEIVDTLLGLFDQRVAVDFPGQVLGLAVHLFQCLINWHRTDRHRRIADDPFARFVDVLAGRQVHHVVAAPANGPGHLLDFLADRAGHRRVADVGVDLDQEVAADDHRLDFRVIDVSGNDRTAARDFLAHEFRRDCVRNAGAERLARVLAAHQVGQLVAHRAAGLELFQILLAPQVFADRDEFHFRCDDALARIVHLRNVLAGQRAARLAMQVKAQFSQCRVVQPFDAVCGRWAGQFFSIVALGDPGAAHRCQAGADVDVCIRVGIRARRVIHINRWIFFCAKGSGRVRLADLAHRHADVRTAALHIDFAGIWQRCDRGCIDCRSGGQEFRIGVHSASL